VSITREEEEEEDEEEEEEEEAADVEAAIVAECLNKITRARPD